MFQNLISLVEEDYLTDVLVVEVDNVAAQLREALEELPGKHSRTVVVGSGQVEHLVVDADMNIPDTDSQDMAHVDTDSNRNIHHNFP